MELTLKSTQKKEHDKQLVFKPLQLWFVLFGSNLSINADLLPLKYSSGMPKTNQSQVQMCIIFQEMLLWILLTNNWPTVM